MANLDDSSNFPNTELTDPEDDQAISKLIRYLQKHVQKRHLLREEGNQKQINFRNTLVQLVREYESLKHCNNEQTLIISTLEDRVYKLQNQIDGLLCKLNNACEAMRNMQQEVRDRDKQLKEQEIEKRRIIQKYNAKIAAEVDRITKEMEIKLRKQQEWFESCIKKKDDKLKMVRNILSSVHDNGSDNGALKAPTASETESAEESIPISNKASSITSAESQASKSLRCEVNQNIPFCTRINDIKESTAEKPIPTINPRKKSSCLKTEIVQESFPTSIDPSPSTIALTDDSTTNTKMTKRVAHLQVEIKTRPSRRCKIPVVNPRYQSKSSGDKWINHRPAGIVPIGTIMQPKTQPYKRTVQKLTNPKTFRKKDAKYCLLAQEQDTDGELETKLYKADVLPTCGGGAQIVFNDIEYLKQISPSTAK